MIDPGMIGAVLVAIIVSILAPIIMGWVKGQTEKEAVTAAAREAKAEKERAKAERDQEAADRRADKEQDWARQDLVAARAAASALHLEESQQALLISSEERKVVTAELVASFVASTENTQAQLKVLDDGQKVIHTLVNSSLTASMQADLDGKRLLLLALKRNATLEPAVTRDSQDLIVITEAKIAALETELEERAEQQKLADAQIQKQSNDRAEV